MLVFKITQSLINWLKSCNGKFDDLTLDAIKGGKLPNEGKLPKMIAVENE